MVAKDVPYHQDPTILLRDPHEIFAMFDIDSQRLFDEDIFASHQSGFGHLVVSDRRCGQGNRIDGWVGQQPGIVGLEPDSLVTALTGRFRGRVCVAENLQRSEIVEVPYEVLTPITNADYGDPNS